MQETHDVIVVGSGASGGMAAWNLTRQGVNVLMLDAGEKFSRAKFWTHVKPWECNPRVDRRGTTRGPHQGSQRTCEVSFLRKLRPRLRRRGVLQLVRLFDRARDGDRQAAGDGSRRGGSRSGERRGKSEWRPVFRSHHW